MSCKNTRVSIKHLFSWFSQGNCLLKGLPRWWSAKESACQCKRCKRHRLVRSLGQEDSLVWEMTTNFSILVWRIPWIVYPVGLQSMGSQRLWHNWASMQEFEKCWTSASIAPIFHTHTHTARLLNYCMGKVTSKIFRCT